VLFVLMGDY